MNRAIQIRAAVNAVWKIMEVFGDVTKDTVLRAVCTEVVKLPDGVGPIRFVAMVLHVVKVGVDQVPA